MQCLDLEEWRNQSLHVAGSKQIMEFTGWNWCNALRWWHLRGSRERLTSLWQAGKQVNAAVSELMLSCRWAQTHSEVWVTILGHLCASGVLQSPMYPILRLRASLVTILVLFFLHLKGRSVTSFLFFFLKCLESTWCHASLFALLCQCSLAYIFRFLQYWGL